MDGVVGAAAILLILLLLNFVTYPSIDKFIRIAHYNIIVLKKSYPIASCSGATIELFIYPNKTFVCFLLQY